MNNRKEARRLTICLLLLLISIFMALLVGELSMRIAGKFYDIDFRLYMKELTNSDRLPGGLFIPDKILGQRLRSNNQVLATTSDFSIIYKINSKGLRDKEYDYERVPGKVRILAFGDSFTFGEGISYGKRFTDLPEDYFSNLEIINFGVPGYGIDQELVYFATEGLKYSPDYVIIFINWADIVRYSTDIVKNGSVILQNMNYDPIGTSSTLYLNKNDPFFNGGTNNILKGSYFLSYVHYQITLIKLRNKLEQYDKQLWENIHEEDKKRYEGINDTQTEYKDRTKLIIKKFNELCKRNNIKLIIINIDKSSYLDYLNESDDNIVYYNLANELKQEEKEYSLRFRYDGHYNEKAHAFIGNSLIRILESVILELETTKEKVNRS